MNNVELEKKLAEAIAKSIRIVSNCSCTTIQHIGAVGGIELAAKQVLNLIATSGPTEEMVEALPDDCSKIRCPRHAKCDLCGIERALKSLATEKEPRP